MMAKTLFKTLSIATGVSTAMLLVGFSSNALAMSRSKQATSLPIMVKT